MQAAEALVEVGEAGGEAGEAAFALVGGVGDLDRVDDGAAEGLEAAVDAALLAELVERLLGLDDLVLRLAVELAAAGLVGDGLAEQDQLAADREVVDELRVVAGGEERDRRAGEPDEVGRPPSSLRPASSSKNALMVTGVASALRRMRSPATSKMRACTGSKKCAGCTRLATRS